MKSRFLTAAVTGAVLLVPVLAVADGFSYSNFRCGLDSLRGGFMEREGRILRRAKAAADPVREYTCVDKSCFYWGIENAGTDNEIQVVAHVLLDPEKMRYTNSIMTWKTGAEAPVFKWSFVEPLFDCVSPAPID